MHTENYSYQYGQQALEGYLAYDDSEKKLRPAVLVVHDWSGRNEFACNKADSLATMGYVGFAVDMFGQGRIGKTLEEKQAFIQPLMADRQLLLNRINAALTTVKALDGVDSKRIAIIGFCFGGLCALDLARSGADLIGAISFHGLLNKPEKLPVHEIKANILALHGYDDPMAKPEQVELFCQEMTAAKADWQVHMYGNTQHAFTNPQAHDQQLGTIYNALAAKRSWQSMTNFLQEIFA